MSASAISSNTPALRKRAPFWHRVFLFLLSSALTLLCIWLLNFILRDIGNLPGPEYAEIEKRHVDGALLLRQKNIGEEIAGIERELGAQRENQLILQTSLNSSRATMEQMAELARLGLEKDVKPTETEQRALGDSAALYLANQEKFQRANDEITTLTLSQRTLEAEGRALEERLTEARKPAIEEHNALMRAHRLRVAGYKLAFLIPVLFAAAFALWRLWKKPWAALAYPPFLAAFWKVGAVMHEYFPAAVFKYLAIGAAIVIVVSFIVYLLRLSIRPRAEWTLRQTRDAYNAHVCPNCSHPIQRGPMRYMRWGRKGPIGVTIPAAAPGEGELQPYTCPSCGQRLYEKCGACGGIRHTLLPYCEACGAVSPETPTVNQS